MKVLPRGDRQPVEGVFIFVNQGKSALDDVAENCLHMVYLNEGKKLATKNINTHLLLLI